MHVLHVAIELAAKERKLIPLAVFDSDETTRFIMMRSIFQSALARVGLECLMDHAARGIIRMKPIPTFVMKIDLEKR